MEQLYPNQPKPLSEAFTELVAAKGDDWVYASAAITLNGRLGGQIRPFGGSADRRFYKQMLGAPKAIVIGAENLRKTGDWYRHFGPRIAVLSRSGDLPLDSELFTSSGPVTIYTESEADFVSGNDQLIIRRGQFSAAEILDDLGPGPIMIDGGGQIYSFFADEIDDWFLTTVPVLASVDQPQLWHRDQERELNLSWLYYSDNRLLARFSAS